MACCGQQRSALSTSGHLAQPPRGPSLTSPIVIYQYVGTTGLTVVGGATGRTYRFDGPGARAQVDTLDVRSLAGVPHLVRVASV